MATSWTIEDVYKLEAAIAKGVRKVQYQDKMVEYNSIDDMLKALNVMKKQLGLTAKSGAKYAEFKKGLC